VSVTTRPPRDGEIHTKDYFFVDEKEFSELKEKNAFIEFANVHGHQYGTLRNFVNEKLKSGISIILDIDVQGYTQIKDSLQDTISIFIIPPSLEELKNRLIARGLDSKEVIEKRMINAKKELNHAFSFDYLVLNDNFNKALNDISNIIFIDNFEYTNDKNLNILKDLLD
jgi:guanylate kinase